MSTVDFCVWQTEGPIGKYPLNIQIPIGKRLFQTGAGVWNKNRWSVQSFPRNFIFVEHLPKRILVFFKGEKNT